MFEMRKILFTNNSHKSIYMFLSHKCLNVCYEKVERSPRILQTNSTECFKNIEFIYLLKICMQGHTEKYLKVNEEN